MSLLKNITHFVKHPERKKRGEAGNASTTKNLKVSNSPSKRRNLKETKHWNELTLKK